jgi:hypothetical protein
VRQEEYSDGDALQSVENYRGAADAQYTEIQRYSNPTTALSGRLCMMKTTMAMDRGTQLDEKIFASSSSGSPLMADTALPQGTEEKTGSPDALRLQANGLEDVSGGRLIWEIGGLRVPDVVCLGIWSFHSPSTQGLLLTGLKIPES